MGAAYTMFDYIDLDEGRPLEGIPLLTIRVFEWMDSTVKTTTSQKVKTAKKSAKTAWEKPQLREVPIFFEVSLYSASK